MRRFELRRVLDPTGVVAEGVEFRDGKATVRWRGKKRPLVLWDQVDSVVAVYGHDGAIALVWID